jgi:hypothetical protein
MALLLARVLSGRRSGRPVGSRSRPPCGSRTLHPPVRGVLDDVPFRNSGDYDVKYSPLHRVLDWLSLSRRRPGERLPSCQQPHLPGASNPMTGRPRHHVRSRFRGNGCVGAAQLLRTYASRYSRYFRPRFGLAGERERGAPPPFHYFTLMAMRFVFDLASGAFAIVTVSTPFLKDADTLSSFTSSTGMRRSKRP